MPQHPRREDAPLAAHTLDQDTPRRNFRSSCPDLVQLALGICPPPILAGDSSRCLSLDGKGLFKQYQIVNAAYDRDRRSSRRPTWGMNQLVGPRSLKRHGSRSTYGLLLISQGHRLVSWVTAGTMASDFFRWHRTRAFGTSVPIASAVALDPLFSRAKGVSVACDISFPCGMRACNRAIVSLDC